MKLALQTGLFATLVFEIAFARAQNGNASSPLDLVLNGSTTITTTGRYIVEFSALGSAKYKKRDILVIELPK